MVTLTPDASVIISALLPEVYTFHSLEFLSYIKSHNINCFMPNIILTEVSAVLTRQLKSAQGGNYLQDLTTNEHFHFIDIDTSIINSAIRFTRNHKLKGMDSLYLAIAEIYNCTVVSLDKDQLLASSRKVKVVTPLQVLSRRN